MALSKLAIGLITGIGSVAAIGGIAAGVVVSRNNTITATNDESNQANNDNRNKASDKNNALMTDQSRSTSINDESSASEMKSSKVESMSETEENPVKKGTKSDSEHKSSQTGIESGLNTSKRLQEDTDTQTQAVGKEEKQQNTKGNINQQDGSISGSPMPSSMSHAEQAEPVTGQAAQSDDVDDSIQRVKTPTQSDGVVTDENSRVGGMDKGENDPQDL